MQGASKVCGGDQLVLEAVTLVDVGSGQASVHGNSPLHRQHTTGVKSGSCTIKPGRHAGEAGLADWDKTVMLLLQSRCNTTDSESLPG